MRTRVIAHRGASREAPENSLPAFARARELGAEAQELDVRATADGVPVVLHDPMLGRTAHPGGRVADMTLSELRRARLRGTGHSGEETHGYAIAPGDDLLRIPTLREAFEALPGTEVTLDVKAPEAIRPAVELVLELGREDRTILYAEDGTGTREFRNYPGRRATSTRQAVRFVLDRSWAARGSERDVPEVVHTPLRWWGVPLITPELALRVRESGRFLQVWTVDEAGDLERLAEWGVGGIITNEVRRALAVLEGARTDGKGAGSER